MKVSIPFFEQTIRERLNLGHRARPSTITAETELKLQVPSWGKFDTSRGFLIRGSARGTIKQVVLLRSHA